MNVVLTGYAGVGKTSVGEALAGILGRSFLDFGREAEIRAGDRLARIRAVRGEDAVRAVERALIAETARRTDLVVAVLGGTLGDPGNRAALRASGRIVRLTADPAIVLLRISGTPGSPAGAARSREAIGLIRELMRAQDAFYGPEDPVFDTSAAAPDATARAVAAVLTDA